MPLYEYQCEACAHRFEVIQKFSDSPLESCQKCGGQVRKLLSSPAIQFKGSGWYITDYARAGKADTPAAAKAENGSSPSETTRDAKAETTSETKAQPKADTKTDAKSPSKPATSSTAPPEAGRK